MAKSHSGSLRRVSGYLDPIEAAAELELYDELNVFTDLPAEEQERQAEQAHEQFAEGRPENESTPTLDEEDGGFEVVEMSKTRPLVQRPALSRPAQPSKPVEEQVCPSCGAQNPDNDIFCESCGAFLEEAVASASHMPCPECGAVLHSEDIFCPSCGSVMGNN
jgi:predicted RNA-binding Zn-ribbon protein involved in translation (DUF1610 family)